MRKNKIQSINCNIHLATMEYNPKYIELILPANRAFSFIIDYPFDITEKFSFRSKKDMNFDDLISNIIASYKEMYNDPKKYKPYGHAFSGLYLEGVDVDHNTGEIKLHIGS